MHKPLFALLLALLMTACSHGDQNPPFEQASGSSAGMAATPAASAATPPVMKSPATAEPASAPAAAGSVQASPAPDDSAGQAPESASNKPAQAAAQSDADAPGMPADNGQWIEGKNYFLIEPQQPRLSNSDKVQVVEVFSFGCPACFHTEPFIMRLARSLPAYAEMDYLPVSFRPDENFPLYQRAYYTARALGVERKAHDAIFDAVWKSGEIGTYDLASGRPKPKDEWPDINDIARFYAKYGADPQQFVATAKSFAVDTKMKRADQLIKNWQVNSTPTIVIDGKYRYTPNSAGGYDQMIDMTQWLVQKARAEHAAGS